MITHESEAIEQYKRQGVGLIRGLLDQTEVDSLLDEANRLWESQQNLSAFNIRVGLRKNIDGEDILERLDPVADISPLFAALNQDQRIIQLAEAALGEAVIPMKEKLIYKWPGTSGYGAHRDEGYFASSGATGREMVSFSIALDHANAKNGAIMLYPALRLTDLPSPHDEPRDIDVGSLKNEPYYRPDLSPGDVLMFDGLVPHCSRVNTSTTRRRIYMITYVPARIADARENYYRYRFEEQSSLRAQNYKGTFFLS